MAATCAAAYGINARVIDKRPRKLSAVRADGLHARMMEILDTFGLADAVLKHGNEFTATHSWLQSSDGKVTGQAVSSHAWEPPYPFTSVGITQAKIADILLDYVHEHSNIRVERGVMTAGISVDDDDDDYPVRIVVRKVAKNASTDKADTNNDIRIDNDDEVLAEGVGLAATDEIIRAKYVVACDGAHSWIRRSLQIPMIVDDMDIVWGVMDIHPITDLPSARTNNIIQGQRNGLMWIARERGLVRVYAVVGSAKSDEHGKLIRSSVTPDTILAAAQKMLHPYTLTYKKCELWAAYQIGQRVATDNMHGSGRIFLAGDAVHTHSPQAGQGLNVSMADTYNLLWKLNFVLKGDAKRDILETYRTERLVLGQQLVDFDQQWAAIVSGHEPPKPPPGIRTYKLTWDAVLGRKAVPLIHGLQIVSPPSSISLSSPDAVEAATVMPEDGKLPPGITVGMRMPSYQVRRRADNTIQHLGKGFHSDSRFRFIVAKNISALMDRYSLLGLEHISLFDSIVVHTMDPRDLNLLDLPDVLHPLDPELGYDHDKVFYDEDIYDRHGLHFGSAYENYGVDRNDGRLVLLGPDGYVAYQGGLEEFHMVQRYFEGFLIPSGS
ncbi:hypothetical protein PRZ48_005521 [Zasmidium cellare]|uniref:Phenol 2-monooxygenase n=1 Tax=Zasmidium cellare TaxID=395010 RepID=A0ABR0ELL0_ZASCE|nr:hypothetical protein PRZ48_005521 [Zasmidium cellare]